MLSINMRIFKTVLLIGAFGASVRCLPVANESIASTTEATSLIPQETITAAATTAEPTLGRLDAATTAEPTPGRLDAAADYYDQRQNGTENWRVHIDGVVLVFAPVEALLLAGAAGSNLSLPGELAIPSFGDLDKPGIDLQNKTEPAISKTYSINKPGFSRLANFFAPFIRRMRHEQGTSEH